MLEAISILYVIEKQFWKSKHQVFLLFISFISTLFSQFSMLAQHESVLCVLMTFQAVFLSSCVPGHCCVTTWTAVTWGASVPVRSWSGVLTWFAKCRMEPVGGSRVLMLPLPSTMGKLRRWTVAKIELGLSLSDTVITWSVYNADYRYESRTGPLTCFVSTNSRFVARNHQK
jgi:hypothetical protein